MQLSDAEFEKIKKLLWQELGLHFEPHRRYLVEKRVAGRMASLGILDPGLYISRLTQADGRAELQALTNAVTVNETYFNREAYQLDCLTRRLIPEIIERRKQQGVGRSEPIRIWSLPCSTGEEPFSIAMQLLEAWPEVDQHVVDIHASDVDTEVLEKARKGEYSERALRQLPQERREKYFQPIGDGLHRINAGLKRSVHFSHANLGQDDCLQRMPPMDVIFCRNLLIYFNEESRRQATQRLYSALRPGGFLCLGHSESMRRDNSDFEYRRYPEAIIYQRPIADVNVKPGLDEGAKPLDRLDALAG